ncbi:phage integrase family protein [Burkholderia pseudomallei 7894]|uniref:tyrosine-type recombinase/integrase n=1 Tax=Burkholderia pseudomallei TaxID=28450 RepID=UPI0005727DCE|nr:integrase family protein [Burkholderia pseudomallei]AJX82011.1 phage integrase family protein [Burkholderia pseudomallei 7894]ARK68835.1 preprotein translocase [Burkholderia pseudomallei]OMQ68901.1 preprotein translocase [Burkholderia pseudomallei]
MAKVNFTAARVNGHSCPAGKSQAFIWDSGATGLGLRATAAGARSYIWQGKLNGATIRVTIGAPKDWGIDDARDEARRLKRLADSGKDPREEAAEQRAAAEQRRVEALRQDVTVREAWAEYLDANRSKWSERHYSDHEKLAHAGGEPWKRGKGVTVAGPLASLMPLKLSHLTAELVAAWLEAEAETRPTNAEQSYRKLRAFIRWCDDKPIYARLVASNAYAARAVRAAVPRTNAKDDCLQREQLPAWFAAVRQIGNPVISTYLQALLLTGARREEMAGLRWDDVDFQWRSLSIADKVEGSRVIPLTPYLAGILRELKRLNDTPPNVRQMRDLTAKGESWSPSPWVFASKKSADGKIAEPRIAHNQALAVAGLPHLSLHGLRRSFGTLAEWVEVPVGVIAQIQGHKPSAIAEKHYRRRPLDLLRKWHDKIEAWMLEQAGIEFTLEQGRTSLSIIATA